MEAQNVSDMEAQNDGVVCKDGWEYETRGMFVKARKGCWVNYCFACYNCHNSMFSAFCVTGIFALFSVNAIWSLFSCNSAFSILSVNSCMSILSSGSFMSIGCSSGYFEICL
uniref:Uncharacterized protein n=1 Tax=Hemiselmis tepida TaxID=464990 RepID=A0A7S0W6E9_9CRYP|mmetsp:Transcript_37676/g.96288  ORF Transcript_37676/g.96288 Transcript_37676/m.96288 type:complete len:112 (+) Transcript_37676:103-438(+)